MVGACPSDRITPLSPTAPLRSGLQRGVGQRLGHLLWEQGDASSSLATPTVTEAEESKHRFVKPDQAGSSPVRHPNVLPFRHDHAAMDERRELPRSKSTASLT